MSALTDSSGGSSGTTISAVSGTGADATINNNFHRLTQQLNSIIANLQAANLMQ